MIGGEIVAAGEVFLETFRATLSTALYGDTMIVYSGLGAHCLQSGALQVAADWLQQQLLNV